MKNSTPKLASLGALILFVTLSGPVFAATYTVTSADDPEVVDTINCTSPGPACTLREALAAADLDSGHDLVVFDVRDTIYLREQLTVESPVTIDGGGTTTVRVHQKYVISTLPDLYGENPPISVLQPTYWSERSFNRPMLEIRGAGSAVRGLVLDGSITPDPADVGVERIDFNSNNETDRFLLTIDSNQGDPGFKKRWLVSGGITCVLPWGTVEISGNQLKYFNDNAIFILGTFAFDPNALEPVLFPVISENVISGGAAEQSLTDFDGISLSVVVGAEVSGNTVTGFRNGLAGFFFSALRATGNEFARNRTGVGLEYGDKFVDPATSVVYRNEIDDNVLSGNLRYGLSATLVNETDLTDNEVSGNGSDPDQEGGILLFNSSLNTVVRNEIDRNSGFGLVIDGHYDENLFLPVEFATGNQVANNDVKGNGGAGIVILNNSYGNLVEYNDSIKNSVGVVAGFGAGPHPYSNTYQWNTFEKNSDYDVLDVDPACNDVWVANEFRTVLSAANNCVQ